MNRITELRRLTKAIQEHTAKEPGHTSMRPTEGCPQCDLFKIEVSALAPEGIARVVEQHRHRIQSLHKEAMEHDIEEHNGDGVVHSDCPTCVRIAKGMIEISGIRAADVAQDAKVPASVRNLVQNLSNSEVTVH